MNYNNAKQKFETYLESSNSRNTWMAMTVTTIKSVSKSYIPTVSYMPWKKSAIACNYQKKTLNLHVSSPFSMTLAVLNS